MRVPKILPLITCNSNRAQQQIYLVCNNPLLNPRKPTISHPQEQVNKMKTDFAVVLISLATSAIVSANPIAQPNYDSRLQIPQSVFDFQEPNILTRSERPWSAGSEEFVMANSKPNPSAPDPQQTPSYDPLEIPTGGENQEEAVPRKGSDIPFFSKPDIPDTTHGQSPEVNPSNGKAAELKNWLLDLLLPQSW